MDEPKRYGIPGHCFDADGEPWHDPGECTAPECRKKPCCGFVDPPEREPRNEAAPLTERERLIGFLEGRNTFRGLWFHEHPASEGRFWWRKYLHLLASPPPERVSERYCRFCGVIYATHDPGVRCSNKRAASHEWVEQVSEPLTYTCFECHAEGLESDDGYCEVNEGLAAVCSRECWEAFAARYDERVSEASYTEKDCEALIELALAADRNARQLRGEVSEASALRDPLTDDETELLGLIAAGFVEEAAQKAKAMAGRAPEGEEGGDEG